MSNVAPTLKALIKQAKVNSQLILALGLVAKRANLGPDTDQFVEALTIAFDNNKEFVEALDNAVDKMAEGT